MTHSLRFKESGALRGLRVRREKQWVHGVNPLKIGCRDVFSRAQLCAAGLFTLPSSELLFIRGCKHLKMLQPLRLNIKPKLLAPQ
jgi:hypothetical protein